MNTKNIMIIGDSYSTFKGYNPDGYNVYYHKDRTDGATVLTVEDTWWHSLSKELDLNIVLNDSWSGSTVGYRGYENADCSCTSSFIFRLERLFKNGFFEKNKIDTLFIFGATNDSWANVELGELKFSDFTKDDLYFVLPAVSYFIKRAKEILPNANVIYIINDVLKPEIINGIKSACNHFGANYVHLSEIEKTNGHPSAIGMQKIKNQVVDFLKTL